MLDFQAFLDAIVDSVRSRDFERFLGHFTLPQTVITGEGTAVLTQPAQVRAGFDAYVLLLERLGVTDYVRTASSLHMISPVLATGVYQTHLLRNGLRMIDPFPSTATLRCDDGAWRVTSVMSAIPQAGRWLHLPPYVQAEDDAPPDVDPAPGPGGLPLGKAH